MLTTIPFAGFYNSVHDDALDRTLDQMFSDRETGCTVNAGLVYRASMACNWQAVYVAYARDYCERFGLAHGITGLVFDELSSPREYNFETDRIFAEIPDAEVSRLLQETAPADLARVATERFTSYDGFISSYSPDVAEWGPVDEWDHNQVGTLLIAHAGDDWDERELYLMDDADLDNWIAEATPNMARLYRVHDYLQERDHA